MNIKQLSNAQIATLAVAFCGGDMEYIDREDVAIQADKLAPGRFSWRKYPDRIDLDAVGGALRDAKKSRNGSLVIGSNTTGWMLSPAGAEWLSHLNITDLATDTHTYRRESIEGKRETERERLRRTRAFKLFAQGNPDEIQVRDLFRFLRINEYFQSRAKQRRLSIVKSAVANDQVLAQLWEFLSSRFREELD